MKERFEAIYRENVWHHGSGEGSLLEHTRPYISMLQSFLARNGIKSAIDYGCGDWQFSRHVDWSNIDYTGYDIAPYVISRNRDLYARDNIRFIEVGDELPALPPADLLIVKDVLQHWSDGRIQSFLPQLKKFRFCLITNCINPRGETVHRDIDDGDFRYLDLRAKPFQVKAEVVLEFENHRPALIKPFTRSRWKKHVLLISPGES